MSEKVKSVGRDLTTGPVLGLLITFALPMVLTNLVQQLYSTVDLMIIGQYVGSIGTVGVSTGGELIDLMTPLSTAIGVGGQIYIAQLVGAKADKKVKEAIGTFLSFMMIISIIVMIVTLVFHGLILDWLNCPEEALSQATSYMMITAVGMPFVFGYNAVASTLRGMGESKKPLIFIIIAASINIVTDLLFVAVFHMEATGAALATVLSQAGSFFASLYYMYKYRETFDFEMKLSYFKIHGEALGKIMVVGIPQMIRVICVQGSMLWVKANINSYGLVTSSTYSIGNKIEKFMNVFTQGVDGAAGAMIGQNIGAHKQERVSKILWNTLFVNAIVTVLIIACFLGLPEFLFSLFTTDAEVIEYGVTYLRIMAIGMVVVCFASSFKPIATGVGDSAMCFILGVLDGVCRILICLLFFYVFNQGAESYFWGAAFCQLIPGIISFVYFLSGTWKKKKSLAE